jgi:hypothetical protein
LTSRKLGWIVFAPMKTLTASILALSVLFSVTAFAAEKKGSAVATPPSYSDGGSAGKARWGLGVATYSYTGLGSSVSAMIDMDGVNMIQPMFTITTSSPFSFDVGAMYKRKLSHGGNSGFHLGGGLGLGTNASLFTIAFGGVAGIHYNLPGTTDLVLHLDAGPVFRITDGNFNFSMSAFSAFFGGSIVYMF